MLDEYIIHKIDEYQFHHLPRKILTTYNIKSIPNILLYGPKNSGKKTLLSSYIAHINNIKILKKEIKEFHLKVNYNDVHITLLRSQYHFEINLFEYGLYDKHVLCKFIKDLASTKNLNGTYKLIVLNNIENISKLAQLSLRRLMEKLIHTARFFMTSNSLSKVDDALISRCLGVRVPSPSNKELYNHINYINLKLNLNLSDTKKTFIVSECKRDLYVLNIMILNRDSKYTNPITIYIKKIHDILINENIKFIDNIRIIIYKLHLLNYNNSEVIREFILYISDHGNFTNHELSLITEEGALNDWKTTQCSKPFYCLEKFFIFIKRILYKKNESI